MKAVEQNFDLSTPEGKLMFHLLGSLGEFYSDNLSKETHKGKYERAMQGFHNGWVPWGYVSKLVDGRKMAIPDENLREDVKQVFELFATGLYYDQQIADWINERGYKTFRGGAFTKDSVRMCRRYTFFPFLPGLIRVSDQDVFVAAVSTKPVQHLARWTATVSISRPSSCSFWAVTSMANCLSSSTL